MNKTADKTKPPIEINILHRNPEDYKNISTNPNFKHMRSYNRNIHLFQREIEYKRALNATKMDKIFAKPLVKCLDGHDDSIRCLCVSNTNLSDLYSGSCNGYINVWNILNSKLMRKIKAHDGFVRGLCISYDEKILFSCGDDKYIKQWVIDKNKNLHELDEEDITQQNVYSIDYLKEEIVPKKVYTCKNVPNSIDKHFTDPLIVSGSQSLDVWDYNRNNAIASFDYNNEYIYYVKFNYAQKNLVGLTLSDNSVGLVDIRTKTPIKKIFLKYRSNSLSWNNMNPKHFIVANEDSNLYTFDIRFLKKAYFVHEGFVNAVLDVDYSPIGDKFVACSYDKTVRLFNSDNPKSYDVYHTRRMQRVLCCKYTLDSKYVISGSSDMCLRVWKSCAHEPTGVISFQEKKAINYRNKLKEKFASLKEIKRIRDHHHVPALIKNMSDKKKVMLEAKKKKENNRMRHSKNKNQIRKTDKEKIFVTEQ
ncbi:protein SOF1, putative [Hepatocystis sp. ex Piliocolobus tephrosceles]|nr:protein SOF1, putative [Hepatocystis sp. ex Piliocolobus tephrosceles]